jgi:hypothetical protein
MKAKYTGPKPEKFAFVIEQKMNALLSQAVLQTDIVKTRKSCR